MTHRFSFRNRILWGMVLAVILPAITIPATHGQAPANTAVVPVPKLEDDCYDWHARHAEVLKIKDQIKPEIVMIGDSITHFWGASPRADAKRAASLAAAVWRAAGAEPGLRLGPHAKCALAAGSRRVRWPAPALGGDQHWHEQFLDDRPCAANTPAQVAEGIRAICVRVHSKSPESQIIVMGVFPRGAKADDPYRIKITELNEILAELGQVRGSRSWTSAKNSSSPAVNFRAA